MRTLIALLILAASAAGQNLTPAQKESDFRALVNLMNGWYAPLDWKKQLFGFDALDAKPWLDKVAQTKSDLDFYEVCVDYIAALRDTHSSYALPSDFVARLGFSVDLFDDKVIVDSIDRTLLPLAAFPFGVGDEIVSIDGVPADQLVERFLKYSPQGNDRSMRRQAAARLPTRAQSRMPHATEVGAQASVEVRRQSGVLELYTLRWNRTGTPLEVGPVPAIRGGKSRRSSAPAEGNYMTDLEQVQHSGVSAQDAELGVLNYGSRNPVFVGALTAAAGFTRRLGGATADFFYSGVFTYQGLRIGYLRVPSYSPSSTTTALQQLDAEIDYFNANTDGLIVDEMRNPGGNLCFGENVMQRLSPDSFWTTGLRLRAFYSRVMSFYNSMISAKSANAAPEIIQQYELLYQAMVEANQRSRGVTDPIPICSPSLWRDPARAADGHIVAYTGPIIMLIDEFSTSTADSVPAMFQENRRGLLYGMRSNGAGGNNISIAVGAYSEGTLGMTIGVQARRSIVSVPGYPATNILENVGVHPDVVNDYMTRDNLLQNGAPFVRQFLDRMADYIRTKR